MREVIKSSISRPTRSAERGETAGRITNTTRRIVSSLRNVVRRESVQIITPSEKPLVLENGNRTPFKEVVVFLRTGVLRNEAELTPDIEMTDDNDPITDEAVHFLTEPMRQRATGASNIMVLGDLGSSDQS